MDERFKIVFEASTEKFKQQVNGLKGSLKSVGEQAKFNLGVDTKKSTAQINYIKAQIRELQNLLSQADKGFEVGDTLKIEQNLERLENQLAKIESSSNRFFGNFAKNMKTSFSGGINNGVKKLKRFTLALFGVHSIYRMLSRASSAYLAQDSETAQKLQSAWIGLGSIFAPVLQRVADFVIKAVKYLDIFWTAFTGKGFLTNAMEKATKKATGAVKALNKQLAGFDEITNIGDTSGGGLATPDWTEAFKGIEVNAELADALIDLGKKLSWVKDKVNELNSWFSELDATTQLLIGGAALGGLILVLSPKLAGAIGVVTFAISGFNDLLAGNTTTQILGIIKLFGAGGLAGALIGGTKGMSVGLAFTGIMLIISGFNDLLSGDTTTQTKGVIKLFTGATGLVAAITLLKGGFTALNTPLLISVGGFVALYYGVKDLMDNWHKMNGIEKTIGVLGAIAIAAASAAAAVGALQSAWSLGLAAAAIVAGIAAISYAISSATKRAEKDISKQALSGSGIKLQAFDTGTNYVPSDMVAQIHKGEAIIPKKFNKAEFFGGGNEETNSLLVKLIEKVEQIEINPYTEIKDVGKATTRYTKNRRRILGTEGV